MSDVWKLDSTYDIYLAENGCTHVGGPVGRQGIFIYEYFGRKKVDYLYYCTDQGKDKVNWFAFYNDSKVPGLSVRAA